ncbi:MraY family glycosyltransferase [Ferruginivarius sediminum]|uniref:Glycosyl transferase n=1 Tax=Ferruginivarius sediminum TaxID=2661937 RepID=A0A369TGQ5_9PROT|nr:glycosyltransferase family 4 protein [Ferruginivarius sediminum]RDD63555.1 glycosyl transferase [Ferruginivarius sediminum]
MLVFTDIALVATASLVVGLLGWVTTIFVRKALLQLQVFDAPNDRSSHTVPKPRGGGVAVISTTAVAWIATWAVIGLPDSPWAILAVAVALAGVSFIDDVQSLPPLPRFAAQVAAVALGLAVFDGGPVFQGLLPVWLDRLLAGLAWLWFVNLFNFMDGIDGISGVEAIAIGGGLSVVAWSVGLPGYQVLPPLFLAAAAAGFLVLNWQPSRIFLGDAGSIGLGFLLGWLLLDAAARGLWAPALILPGYYLADATITLLKRLFRGEKIWRAHREHAYQKAVDAGWSHARVALNIAVANLALVACALAALFAPVAGLAVGAGVIAALLWRLAGAAQSVSS